MVVKASLASDIVAFVANFRPTRFVFEKKGLTLGTGERHVIKLGSGLGKRIQVEEAFFHTDSSVFLRSGPGDSEQFRLRRHGQGRRVRSFG